ncbi:amidohydrolase family protein [Nisaea sp.]|uniref:amidohydrolase family protein n=1 Tax=Nisaea sp. TaxID=2024842 RepID=UPI0032997234
MNLIGANSLMGLNAGRFDGHAHVFRADLPMVGGRRYSPAYDALPGDFCRLLKQFDLDGALLVQPSFLGSDNSYLLKVLEDYAGSAEVTFRGVAVLDPGAPIDRGMLREMEARGVLGIRLNFLRKAESFRYADWAPVLGETEKLGWHVELHVESEHLPAILPQLTARHEKVVVDHFGLVGPAGDCAGMQALFAQPKDRLWVKISGAYRILRGSDRSGDAVAMKELRARYLDHFGHAKLVWGSDWPFTQFEDQMTYDRAFAFAG